MGKIFFLCFLSYRRYKDNPGIAISGKGSIGTPGFLAGMKYTRDKYGSHEVNRVGYPAFE